MANFKKLAAGYEKVALGALQRFIRIPSVYDEKTIGEGAPYGRNVEKALAFFAELGANYGFKVDRCNGYCTELSIGEEGPLIGIYGHSDVVPVSGKWDHPEFGGEIKDGRVWGRGACDDKGPLLASLFAVKLLKDNGLLKGFRVKIVSGGDEERGSSCLRYYFEEHKGEHPRFGFTPDANWPLIYAEKGINHCRIKKNINLDPIIALNGGFVANAVCDSLIVTLLPNPKFEKYLKDNSIPCDINSSKELLIVRFIGKTAHGSLPETGVNAGSIAFKALGDFFKKDEFKKIGELIASPFGEVFGGNQESPELGKNTYNYGIFSYDGKTLTISLDFRYGEKADSKACLEKLAKYLDAEIIGGSESKPLLYDKKSPLVSTLMKAYKRETLKLFAKPLAIGGGTYAKEAPNTVAFGAEWPGHEGNMHSPNEYIYVEDFMKDIAIYARAILMLGKHQ